MPTLTRSEDVLSTAPTLIPFRANRTNIVIANEDTVNSVDIIDNAEQSASDGVPILPLQKGIIKVEAGDNPEESVLLLAENATVTVSIREVFT